MRSLYDTADAKIRRIAHVRSTDDTGSPPLKYEDCFKNGRCIRRSIQRPTCHLRAATIGAPCEAVSLMQLQTRIESKLQDALLPEHLEVVNESTMHNVAPGSETHFRVFVVSAAFSGETLVRRHQRIYQLLEAERQDGIHALGIQTLTPEEFAEAEAAHIESPPCLGGDSSAKA